MSLILAVEPDRRQARELTSLVRRHLKAEILIADSGAAALEALDGRVPDLILTPALLPPRDEAVLTGWLRDLGDNAGHVQTLAIPILAATDSRARDNGSGIFGRLRDQSSSEQGCDPSMFAEQVKVYLERAAGERPVRIAPVPVPVPAPAPVPAAVPPVVTAPPDDEETIELDEVLSLDDLVIEGPSFERTPAAEPPPPVTPPARSVAQTPPVEAHVLRAWEEELGLNTSPDPAPPLWRVGDHRDEDVDPPAVDLDAAATATPGTWGPFDLAQPHMAALLRRLDEVAAGTPAA